MKIVLLTLFLSFSFSASAFEILCQHPGNPPVKEFTLTVKAHDHVLVNNWEEAHSPWGPVAGDMIFDGYFRTISGQWAGERITLNVPYVLLVQEQKQAKVEYLVRGFEGWELYSTTYLCHVAI